jgi:hypothetical protein
MWFTSKAPAFKNEDWGTPNFKTIQSPGHPPEIFSSLNGTDRARWTSFESRLSLGRARTGLIEPVLVVQ